MPSRALAALERLRLEYGAQAAARKRELLDQLARERQPNASAVLRLHEALCFLRAYPDDTTLLAQVRGLLAAFASRADLRAARDRLAGSGIAGTAIRFRFFAGQAQWLAERWPAQLTLDRSDADADARIARVLPALLPRAAAQALIESGLPGYAALDRLRGDVTDATCLLRLIAAMPGDTFMREAVSDGIDASFTLAPGADTPSRTAACFSAAPVVFRRTPPPRARPDLRAEIVRAPRNVRRLSLRHGEELADQARAAMALRERSLEAFSFADARDAWLIDDGDGLAFGALGMVPERRYAVAAVASGLALRNGVPVGYWQSDMVGRSAGLSFNTFDTFRGAGAAFTFARLLAALHHVYGSRSFSFDPYQLGGDGNDEGFASGAWWFYAKLGFAPRDAATLALARTEQARVARNPRHRSREAVLRRLVAKHMFFDVDLARALPLPPLPELGLRAGAASADAGRELMTRCGISSLHGYTPTQREAWRRIAPVLVQLNLEAWSAAERAALVEVVRAKGARSERSFVQSWAAHPRLHLELLTAGVR